MLHVFMSKKLSIIVVSIFAAIGIFLGITFHSFKSSFPSLPGASPMASSFSQTITKAPEQINIPTTLTIPKIGVSAQVESVGLDAQGKMDIPRNYVDVAWYDLGQKPGEKGSAVIDGHLDTPTGAPGVFSNISRLTAGDTIVVTDSNGKQYMFSVVDTESYPYNAFPLQKVFATNDQPRLNLITCQGKWDAASHNYSNRVVVYAVLKNPM